MRSRPQVAPTEDWWQIELLARVPGQRTYELIRPVVLFGQSSAGLPRRAGRPVLRDAASLAADAIVDVGRRRVAAGDAPAGAYSPEASVNWHGTAAPLRTGAGQSPLFALEQAD